MLLQKGPCFNKVCKGPSSLNLIKVLGLNIAFTEEIVQKTKKFVQTNVWRKGKQESVISKSGPMWKSKTNVVMLHSPDQDSLEEQRRVHLQHLVELS